MNSVDTITTTAMDTFPWLSVSIGLPIIFGILILSVLSNSKTTVIRWAALLGAVSSFLVTLPLYFNFNKQTVSLQFVEQFVWIPRFNINYHLGIDSFALWLILLTAFITIVVVIAAWEVIEQRVAQYFASFLILSGLMIGVFSSVDAILFYVFFEATLVPMYLIIGIWGGVNRIYASFKFFLYTLLGSLLMLVSLVYLYRVTGSFNLMTWANTQLSLSQQTYLFFAFLMAFAVKVPMFPLHTWLPDVHVEAPTGGSAVLAAIMLKLGAYGFLRFSLPITPDASYEHANLMIVLSLVAVIYVGLIALIQTDMKKLVAYSSIAHMGFVTLGFFMLTKTNPENQALAFQGAYLQMISHGLISAAMFLSIGVLYDRMHTRNIADYGGVINKMPKFAALFLLFTMANAGLPGTSGFIGEFMVILGAVKYDFLTGFLAATALILGASYSLWMYKRVILGEVANSAVAELNDLNRREFWLLVSLACLILYMGIYPAPITDTINQSVTHLLQHIAQTKLK
jgi:NADH-quinone oxidoreductase subunit M